MWSALRLISLFCLFGIMLGSAIKVVPEKAVSRKERCSLDDASWHRRGLSLNATISHNTTGAPRWSEFDAPQPGTVVNVATEQDVQVVVQYCVQHGIPFLAQNGGHGWISSFNLGQNGYIINLAGIKAVSFSSDKTQATIQGGALIQDVINAAYANNVQVLTGNCNCVGTLGAGLGGGYGYLLGLHGFSVDNILALNVVLADGTAHTITPSDTDLWWAFRGAGPNFGIVLSVVMKAYPVTDPSQNMAWLGGLYFTPDKVEAIVQAIQDLHLQAKMNIFLVFVTTGPPSYTPTILVTPFYYGSEADGKAAFASIYAVGPYKDTTAETPYNEWNTGGNGFCFKGERKPSYGTGFSSMVPTTWRAIWNQFAEFLQNNGTGFSSVLLEAYSLKYAQSIDASSSSFPNRDVRFNGIAIPWYPDASLDPTAEAFGSSVRDLWRSTDGFAQNRSYVNFAHGDETNDVVYGSNTARLLAIKKKYDPHNVFNHWFNIHS